MTHETQAPHATQSAQELIRAHIDAYQACARACEETAEGPATFALRALGDTHRDLAIEQQRFVRRRDEEPVDEGSWIALGRQWWSDVVGSVTDSTPERLGRNADQATRETLEKYEAALEDESTRRVELREQHQRLRRAHEEFLSCRATQG